MHTISSRPCNRERLFASIRKDLEEFEAANGPIGPSLASVIDAFLAWNGIRGYTAEILNIIEASHD
jgi:hypothetical protein